MGTEDFSQNCKKMEQSLGEILHDFNGVLQKHGLSEIVVVEFKVGDINEPLVVKNLLNDPRELAKRGGLCRWKVGIFCNTGACPPPLGSVPC